MYNSHPSDDSVPWHRTATVKGGWRLSRASSKAQWTAVHAWLGGGLEDSAIHPLHMREVTDAYEWLVL